MHSNTVKIFNSAIYAQQHMKIFNSVIYAQQHSENI